jgi:hypothetical protein
MREIAVLFETATGLIRSTVGLDSRDDTEESSPAAHVARKLAADAALGVLYVPASQGFPDPESQRVVDGAVADDPSLAEAVQARAELAASDSSMVRVIEDVWDALKAKGLVADVDLPQAAQDKLATRKSLRGKAAMSGEGAL